MAGANTNRSQTRIDGANIAIIEARYYAEINDQLMTGARRRILAAGATFEHFTVPGALEIPQAVALCLAAGGISEPPKFDGYIAVGCVIRGETTHYELVAGESSRGLTDLSIQHGALIGNAILTVENVTQAEVRADPDGQDKGGHAAEAVIQLIALQRHLRGNALDG